MSTGRICCRQVDTAEPQESVRTAAQRMSNRSVGTLVVIDDENRPMGILTDRDLAVRVVGRGKDAATTQVADVMSEGVYTVTEDLPIEDALSRMRRETVRRLVVVRDDGSLAGIVSLDDILALLTDELRDIGDLLINEDNARRPVGAQ